MRYFYHYGFYNVGRSGDLIPEKFISTCQLIEVIKDGYDRILEDEDRITKKYNLKGWHYPVALRDDPQENLIMRALGNVK